LVKISYKPPKEIVVFNCVEYPLDEFKKRLKMARATGQVVPLHWAKGVVFLPVALPETEALEERMEGRMFISNVVYALMPNYEPNIARDIPVVDSTYDNTLKELAKWLKKHSKEQKKK